MMKKEHNSEWQEYGLGLWRQESTAKGRNSHNVRSFAGVQLRVQPCVSRPLFRSIPPSTAFMHGPTVYVSGKLEKNCLRGGCRQCVRVEE